VVLEAMALGLVPAVLNYGGPAELVPPGAGFTIPLGSRSVVIRGFADCFQQLIERPQMLTGLSERARAHVFRNYTWEAKAIQMLDVYDWVLRHRVAKPDWGTPLGFAAAIPARPDANGGGGQALSHESLLENQYGK